MTISNAPWLEVARQYRGQAEIVGPEHNPTIVSFFRSVVGKPHADETAWCAAFLGHCLIGAGYPSTNSLLARSYENYGRELAGPVVGCIVVFPRGNSTWQGHVGFVVQISGEWLYVLGGNQGNSVSVQRFRARDAIAYRWPDMETAPIMVRPNTDIRHVQERLHAHGYREAGKIDGLIGSRTRGAIYAFKDDRGFNPIDTVIDDALLAALAEEPTPRPGALAREIATEADVRATGSETIKEGDLLTTVGKVGTAAGGGIAAASQNGLIDKAQDAAGDLSTYRYLIETFQDIGAFLIDHWYFGVIVAGIFIWRSGFRVKFLRVQDHQSGANTGR
jgi:uncharacterized protein (TIGR02594 family)